MSIKSQEGHMRQLALLLTTDLGCIFDERESGPNGSKKAFLNVGKVFLRALAKDLGLHEVTVSANSGGIAVSGTCSLYGMWEDRGIAVWIEQRLCADGKVLCYALPDHTIEVNAFKGERFNQKELEQQLRRCNSFAQMMARSELDSGVKRPLLPLSISQIGLIGGSGMINGLIACDTPHIIKGRIVKVIRTESEEKFSAQGNHIGSEVKETITNKMIFNVLTPNGFKALT